MGDKITYVAGTLLWTMVWLVAIVAVVAVAAIATPLSLIVNSEYME